MPRQLVPMLGLAAAFAAACDSSSGPNEDDTAEVRVMHAKADAPAVDLVIDGEAVIEGVAFNQASAFAAVEAGSASLAIAPAAGGTAIGTAATTLEAGRRYTVLFGTGGNGSGVLIAADTSVSVPDAPPPREPSDTGAIPGESKIKLRVIHNAPGAPLLDAYLSQGDAPIEAALKIVEPFTYGVGLDPQFPGYLERDPGVWRVRFTVDNTLDVLLDTGPISMHAGQVRSIILSSTDTTGLGVAIIRER